MMESLSQEAAAAQLLGRLSGIDEMLVCLDAALGHLELQGLSLEFGV